MTTTTQTADDVHDAVQTLLPQLRRDAQATEDLRGVPGPTIDALAATGLFRMLQPRRHGGLEASPVEFYRAIELLAGACGSTGWVASVLGVHAWHLALFDERAQHEVWGSDPDTLVASSYAPSGRAVMVPDGLRLRGRWSYASGCDHAAWMLLGGVAQDEAGAALDYRTFLVPRSDVVVDDVWDSIGLRGTGSHDVVVEDVVVPHHRTLSFADTSLCRGPGQAVNDAPLYRLPFASVFANAIAAPVVGMARGAYEAYLEWTRSRIRTDTGVRAVEDSAQQTRVAESAAQLESATIGLERTVDEQLALVGRGEPVPVALRVRSRRDQVDAVADAIATVDRLFEGAGGGALRAGTPIQRFWRDAHAGRAHAINDPEKVRALYGRHQLGEDVADVWV